MMLERKAQQMKELVELERVTDSMILLKYGERRVSVLMCCKTCSCTAFEMTGKNCWHIYFCEPHQITSVHCACQDPPECAIEETDSETNKETSEEQSRETSEETNEETSEQSRETSEEISESFGVVSTAIHCVNPARYRTSRRKKKAPNYLKSYVVY